MWKNESSESRTNRLATQSQYQRQKIANESAQCREDCSTNVNIRKKILKMDQQTIADKRDWQTSINIRMRKMYIVQLLLSGEIRKFHATVQSTFALY